MWLFLYCWFQHIDHCVCQGLVYICIEISWSVLILPWEIVNSIMIAFMVINVLSMLMVYEFQIYSPHLDSPPPRWVHLAHGLLLFLYQVGLFILQWLFVCYLFVLLLPLTFHMSWVKYDPCFCWCFEPWLNSWQYLLVHLYIGAHVTVTSCCQEGVQ